MSETRPVREYDIAELSRHLGELAGRDGVMLAAAESCTGGWVAKAITDIAGSSGWFERGFVTYTNAAKEEMLGVDPAILETQGAVSEATVIAMAEGALAHSRADLSVAVSGIAGPGGGSPDKPVGMVCFAWAAHGHATRTATDYFDGDRDAVRLQSVGRALHGFIDFINTR